MPSTRRASDNPGAANQTSTPGTGSAGFGSGTAGDAAGVGAQPPLNPAATAAAAVPGPAAAAQPSPPASPASPADALRQLCADSINHYRASVGLPALSLHAQAVPCVDQQAHADGLAGRAHANFGGCGEHAQDECPNYGSGDLSSALTTCLSHMWAEGPGGGHYDIMTSTRYQSVGCGFTEVNGRIWMVQDFFH